MYAAAYEGMKARQSKSQGRQASKGSQESITTRHAKVVAANFRTTVEGVRARSANGDERLREGDGYGIKWAAPQRYHPYVKVRRALTIKVDERPREGLELICEIDFCIFLGRVFISTVRSRKLL